MKLIMGTTFESTKISRLERIPDQRVSTTFHAKNVERVVTARPYLYVTVFCIIFPLSTVTGILQSIVSHHHITTWGTLEGNATNNYITMWRLDTRKFCRYAHQPSTAAFYNYFIFLSGTSGSSVHCHDMCNSLNVCDPLLQTDSQ